MSEPEGAVKSKRSGGIGRMIGWGLFWLVTLAVVCVTTWATSMRRSATTQLARLERDRQSLQELAARVEAGSRDAARKKSVLWNVLRHCRSADDIPDFGGDRIIARNEGYGDVMIYVPEGSHSLEISFKWNPAPQADAGDAAEKTDVVLPTGQQSWRVPLLPASGYALHILTDRTESSVGWELTGNHPDFESRSERLPLDRFASRSSSWSGDSVALFPNQIERFTIYDLERIASQPPGVEVLNATMRGPSQGQQYEIGAVVRIVSEGPRCISASDARDVLLRNRPDLLMPYQGGGRYEIRIPGPEKPPDA